VNSITPAGNFVMAPRHSEDRRLLRALIKERITLLLCVLVLGAILRFVADFSWSQSLILAVLFTLVAVWMRGLYELAQFHHCRIVVALRTDKLRRDLREGTQSEEPDWATHIFTALSPTLWSHDGAPSYLRRLWFRERLSDPKIAWSPGFGSSLGESPEFFMRPVARGYEIGLQVEPVWWASHSSQLAPELRDLPIDERGDLQLGILPYEFTNDKHDKKLMEKLQHCGWSLQEEDEFGDGDAHVYTRYLGVSINRLH
jgi:hypothetical protein